MLMEGGDGKILKSLNDTCMIGCGKAFFFFFPAYPNFLLAGFTPPRLTRSGVGEPELRLLVRSLPVTWSKKQHLSLVQLVHRLAPFTFNGQVELGLLQRELPGKFNFQLVLACFFFFCKTVIISHMFQLL